MGINLHRQMDKQTDKQTDAIRLFALSDAQSCCLSLLALSPINNANNNISTGDTSSGFGLGGAHSSCKCTSQVIGGMVNGGGYT